jgi:hypothetical protein
MKFADDHPQPKKSITHTYDHNMNQLRPTIAPFLRPCNVLTMETSIRVEARDNPV